MSITPYSYGNIPTYRFYISEASSVTYEVFPLNFLSSSLNDSQENDQIFYRRKFAGSLLFGTNSLVIDNNGVTQNRKDDWALLWGIEQTDPCEKLFLTITKTVSGSTTAYWEGYFSTTDGSFDIDKCTFEVVPMTIDDYTDLLSEADTQYDIFYVTPTVSTRALFGAIDITFTRNRWLLDVIEYLADKVVPGVIVSSDFFTAATNPVTLSDNHLLYLTIAQKSDIIRPTSSDPATTVMMSWTELTEILWGMFQVKWNYDGVNTINVEHISWFAKIAGIDLRTQLSCVATNKYSYLKEKMPKYEKFAFMEADTIDFVGTPIRYESGCVNNDPESNTVTKSIIVTTDLEYIISTPDAIADEGFVILCNYLEGGLYYVESQAGRYFMEVRLNNRLSWANLHNDYFRHNRVLIEGYLNNLLTTFWTTQKNKVQDCTAIICDDYDPNDEITTELGESYLGGVKGSVRTGELSPTGKLKLSLGYGPLDNEPTIIEDLKFIKLIQVPGSCWSFDAVLTEPMDVVAGIDIVVTETIYDSLGATVCTGAGETWHIDFGDRTHGFFFAAPCNGGVVPAGGIGDIAHTASVGDWIITIEYTLNDVC